jgi:hypothetical protein
MFKMLHGSTEYVTIKLTETTGKDLSTTTVKVAFLAPGLTPDVDTVWVVPSVVTHVGTSVINVKMLLGPTGVNLTVGRWQPWAQITDTPEIPVIPAEELVLVY